VGRLDDDVTRKGTKGQLWCLEEAIEGQRGVSDLFAEDSSFSEHDLDSTLSLAHKNRVMCFCKRRLQR
jgi:hypothetical protein